VTTVAEAQARVQQARRRLESLAATADPSRLHELVDAVSDAERGIERAAQDERAVRQRAAERTRQRPLLEAEAELRSAIDARKALDARVMAGEDVGSLEFADADGRVTKSRVAVEREQRALDGTSQVAGQELRRTATERRQRRAQQDRQRKLAEFRRACEEGKVGAPFLEQLQQRPESVDPDELAIWREVTAAMEPA
jgi:hypothetical protein